MATGTNGIATYADCNSLSGETLGSNTSMCPTYSDIIWAYANLDVTGSYNINQCVKYSDLYSTSYPPMDLIFSQTKFSPLGLEFNFTMTVPANNTSSSGYGQCDKIEIQGGGGVGLSYYMKVGNITVDDTPYYIYLDLEGESATYNCQILFEEKDIATIYITPYSGNAKGTTTEIDVREEYG